MNMRRRGERALNEKSAIDRRPARGDDLVPWADPYIAELIRDHERQSKAYKVQGSRVQG
jgi:hypothetical protein